MTLSQHDCGAALRPATRQTPIARTVRGVMLASAGALVIQAGLLPVAYAGPQGGAVVAGQGAISSPDAATTVVNQQSHALTLNWQSFDVAPNELVQFNQPSASASVLNRVLNQSPTQILGSIKANGKVFIQNGRGVVFGQGARVEVGALFASSLDIKTEDFMAGRYEFEALPGEDPGAIVNRGLIQASTGGFVSLVGGSATNEGVIIAEMGQVHLAAGRKVTLDFDGDGLIRFEVDGALLENPDGVADAVSNTGEIRADGGQVLLTAQAAQDVFTRAVNNEGVVRAGRIENQGGKIMLTGLGGPVRNAGALDASAGAAGDDGGVVTMRSDGDVEQSGVLTADASDGRGGTIELVAGGDTILAAGSRTRAVSAAGAGGTVHALGERVGMMGDASIDVSGATGGGTALIGGDYQGASPEIRNASASYVAPGASIRADATVDGDGGTIIVWADDVTRFFGAASARGGTLGGDGGFVETSGKRYLEVSGARVDASAPAGKGGQWLLDPTDITITNVLLDTEELADTPVAGTNQFQPVVTDPATGTVNVADIHATLVLGTNVVVTTTGTNGGGAGLNGGRITVDSAISPDLSMTAGAQDVTLSLIAAENIDVNAGITVGGADDAGDRLSISLQAGGQVDVDAAVDLSNPGTAGAGGDFSSTGTAFDNTGFAIDTDGGTFTVTHTGAVIIGGAVTTAGGTLNVTGAGVSSTAAGSITTTAAANGTVQSGAVTLNATGTNAIALGGSVITAGADDDGTQGTARAGGNVVIATTDGSVSTAIVNAAGGAGTAGTVTGGAAGTVTITANGATSDASLGGAISAGGGGGTGGGGNGAAQTVALIAGRNILDAADGSTTITAGALNLTASAAAATIGATGAGAIDTALTGTLTASATTGAGGIFVSNTGDLAVGTVNAGTGDIEVATTGNITDATSALSGANANLTASGAGSAIGATGAGAIDTTLTGTLTANATTGAGGIFVSNTGDLNVGTVNAATGNVELTSTTGSIVDSTSAVTAADLALTANTAAAAIGATGAGAIDTTLSGTLTASASSGAGGIFVADAGALSVGVVNAGSGDVELSAGNGAITDANADTVNVTGGALTLAATNGAIGASGDPLDTDVTTLASATTAGTGGGVFVRERDTTTSNGLAVSGATATGAGNDLTIAVDALALTINGAVAAPNVVTLSSGGAVALSNTVAGATIGVTAGSSIDNDAADANALTAATVNLAAATGIGATNAVEISASNVTATNSTSGNVNIDSTLMTAGADAVAVTTLTNAGGGTIQFDHVSNGDDAGDIVTFTTVTAGEDGDPADGEADVTLTATGSDLVIATSAPNSVQAGTTQGDLSLSASGTVNAVNAKIVVNEGIRAGQNVMISAPGDVDVTVAGLGAGTRDVEAINGNVTVTSTSGTIFLRDSATPTAARLVAINGPSGTQNVTTVGNVTIENADVTLDPQILADSLTSAPTPGSTMFIGTDAIVANGGAGFTGGYELSDAALATLLGTGSIVTVGAESSGNTVFDLLAPDFPAADVGGGATQASANFTLVTGGTIDDSGVGDTGGLGAYRSSGTLTLTAGGAGIGTATTLNVDVGSLVVNRAAATPNIAVNVTNAGTASGGGTPATTNATFTVNDVGNGAVILNQTIGNLQLAGITTTGTTTLNATAGSITQSSSTVTSGALVMTTSVSGESIGATGAGAIATALGGTLTVNAATGPGGVFVSNTGDLAVGTVNAGTGDVELSSTGNMTDATSAVSGTNASLTASGAGSAVGATGAGAIDTNLTGTLTATASSGAGGIYVSNTGNLDVGAVDAAGGNVELTSTTGSILDSGSSAVTATNLALTANTASASIGATGAGAIDTALAGTLTANATTGAGGIYVSNTGNLAVGTVNAGTGNVELTTTGNMTDATSAVSGTNAALTASGAGSAVGATGAGAIDTALAGTLTASATSGAGGIYVSNAGDLNVGVVNAATGNVELTSTTGSIVDSGSAVTATDLALTANTAAAAVGATGAGAIDTTLAGTLTASATTGAGGIYVSNTGNLSVGTVNAGTGNVELTAVGGDVLSVASAVTGALVRLEATGGTGGIGTSGARLNTTAGGLTLLTAGNAAEGDIFVSDGGALNTTAVSAATSGTGTQTVDLTATAWTTGGALGSAADNLVLTASTGGIVDGGAALTATNLTLAANAAGQAVGATGAGAIDTVVTGTLAGSAATGAGGVYVSNAGNLNVGTVNAATGNVELTSTTGSIVDSGSAVTGANLLLTANTAAAAIGATGAGAIDTALGGTLTANAATGAGGIFVSNTGNLAVGTVNAGTGDIELTTTGNMTDATSAVSGANASLTASGAGSAIGAAGAGAIDTTLTGTLTAGATNGAGGIFVSDTGDLNVGVVNAATGDVELTSTTGSIVDSGSAVTGANLLLAANTAAASVGATGAGAIDTALAGTLTANATTGAGGIYVSNTGNLAVGTVNAGTGNVELTTTGNMTDATSAVSGTNAALTASGAGSAVGATGAGAIDTALAGTLTASATSGAGGIYVSNAGDLNVGVVNAATGNVELTSTTGSIVDSGSAVTATDLALTANTAAAVVGATGAGAIDTTLAGTLTASATTGAGGIYVSNTGNLSVGTVNAGTGNVELTAVGGDVLSVASAVTGALVRLEATGGTGGIGTSGARLNTTAGGLTLLTAGNAAEGDIFVSDGGALNTTAVSAATSGTGTQTVDLTATAWTTGGALGSAADNLVLTASTGGIVDGGAALTATNLTLAANAAGQAVGATGAGAIDTVVTGTLAGSAATGAGGVYVSNAGNLNVGTVNAATGNVELTSTTGSIVDSGSAVTGANLLLTANTAAAAIGATGAGAIDTALGGTLTANAATGAGGIFVSNTGNLAVGTVNAGTGDIELTTTGNMTDATSAVSGANASLTASGAGSAIGAAGAGAIDTTLTGTLTANAATGAGGIFVTDVAALRLGTVNAGTGNVGLTAQAGSITSAGASVTGNDVTLDAQGAASGVGSPGGRVGTNTAGVLTLSTGGANAAGNIYLAEGGGAQTAATINTGNFTTAGSAQTVDITGITAVNADLSGTGLGASDTLVLTNANVTENVATGGLDLSLLGTTSVAGNAATLNAGTGALTLSNATITRPAGIAIGAAGGTTRLTGTNVITTDALTLGGTVLAGASGTSLLITRNTVTAGSTVDFGGADSVFSGANLTALSGFANANSGTTISFFSTKENPGGLPNGGAGDTDYDVEVVAPYTTASGGQRSEVTLVARGDINFSGTGKLTGSQVNLIALGRAGEGLTGSILDDSTGSTPGASFVDASDRLVMVANFQVGEQGNRFNFEASTFEVRKGSDEDAFVDPGSGQEDPAIGGEADQIVLAYSEPVNFFSAVGLTGGSNVPTIIPGLETTGLGELGFIDEGLFLLPDPYAAPDPATLVPPLLDSDFPGDLRPDDPDDIVAWTEFYETILREYVEARYLIPEGADAERVARLEGAATAEFADLVSYYDAVRERERRTLAAEEEALEDELEDLLQEGDDAQDGEDGSGGEQSASLGIGTLGAYTGESWAMGGVGIDGWWWRQAHRRGGRDHG